MARSGFYDLNIRVERGQPDHMNTLVQTLQMAYKLGYDTVAVNTIVENEVSGTETQKKKKDINKIPDPIDIDVFKITGSDGRPFRVLNRLSVILQEPENATQLAHPQAKKYDILAVQPVDAKTFQMCCLTLDVDIIYLTMTKKFPMFPKRPQVGKAKERGIFFEISYVPSFIDSFARRSTIANAAMLLEVCRGKNLFVSSDAQQQLDLRSPYDVINMTKIFGFNPGEAKSLITAGGRSVVLKSETRRFGNGVCRIQPISSLSKDDLWKINHCKNGKIISIEKLESKEAVNPKKKRKIKDAVDTTSSKKPKIRS